MPRRGAEPRRSPQHVPVAVREGLCNRRARLPHRHIPGASSCSAPPSCFLPCLSFGPGGLAAGLAASTRNPCHGWLTKHRLSPRSCGPSARLQTYFPISRSPAGSTAKGEARKASSITALLRSGWERHPFRACPARSGITARATTKSRPCPEICAMHLPDGESQPRGHSCLLKEQRDDLPIAPHAQPWAAQRVRRGGNVPSGGRDADPAAPTSPPRYQPSIPL